MLTKTRSGFTLVELGLAFGLGSLLFVALETVSSHQARLEALAAEKMWVASVAAWAGREVVADPRALLPGVDGGASLARRMERLGLPGSLAYQLTTRSLAPGFAEVTVTVSASEGALGRVSASVVVIVRG